MTVRKDSILPKTIDMEKLENPVESVAKWIVKIVAGVRCERRAPITKVKIQEFFPYTSSSLFQEGFYKVLSENKICKRKIGTERSYGFIITPK